MATLINDGNISFTFNGCLYLGEMQLAWGPKRCIGWKCFKDGVSISENEFDHAYLDYRKSDQYEKLIGIE